MSRKEGDIILIAYSGHAYVACDIIRSQGLNLVGYCDREEKKNNPFQLKYLGSELDDHVLYKIKKSNFFTAIGDNGIRARLNNQIFDETKIKPSNIIHKSAIVSSRVNLSDGIMIAGGCQINACAQIGEGVICNTLSVIEHECIIGDYVHVAPGAILCGNVSIGSNSFIGAGSIVKQGIRIGNNVIIGAGSVIVKDVPDNCTVIGNPQRLIN